MLLKHRTFSAFGVTLDFQYGEGYGLTIEQTSRGYLNSPWGIGVTVFPWSRTYESGTVQHPYVYFRVTTAGMDTTGFLEASIKSLVSLNSEHIAYLLGEDDEVYPMRTYKGILGKHNWIWG